MRGKGKSVRQPQSRTCSGRNTLKRCNNNGDGDNVVLIDVDSDTLDNVIIVDIPESLKKKLRGSSVICIDDDEDSDNNHPGVSVDSGSGALSDDGSFSGRFGPAFDHTRNSVDAVGDECQFVQENFPPLKLSKCKRTYSGKASSRNRYGLGPESNDSGSSDNDCPDCEFMEDSFGILREQWEKANMKKKYDVRNGISGRRDQATSSGFHTGTQQNVDVGNLTDQRTQAQVSPDSSNVRCEEESPSPFVQTGDGYSGSTFNSSKKAPFADFGSKSTQETPFSSSKSTTNQDRGESFPVEPPFNNAEGQTNKQTEHGASSFLNEEDQCSQGPSFGSSHEQGNQRIDPSKKFSQDKERTPAAEPCHSNPQPTVDVNIDHTKSSLNSCFPNESEDAGSSSGEKEKLVSGQSSFRNIEPCDEMRVNQVAADNEVGAILKETVSEVPSLGKSGIEKEKGRCQDAVKQVPKEPSLCSIPQNEVHTEPFIGSSEQSGEMSNHQEEEEKDVPSHSLDGDVVDAVSSLINEREKLKETDEYKRAVEEEWASRQRELQLQAEEAQKMRRLRKRRNAQSMRLLDMEKRQKQRVEEVREIQKKDEENMNVKEQLRAEVRKELDKLEITCRDMASLLRGLGIQLGGGFKPLPHEVRAAYKRALLSFHPDRASGSDMRQLVEAEEKFKLISRMKDKFLKTS